MLSQCAKILSLYTTFCLVSHCAPLHSTAIPCPGRCNVSAALLTLTSGASIILDCGEATQHQIMRSRTCKFSSVEAILITHLHGDHFFGIFGLLATLSSNKRESPVTVVGPVGITEALRVVLMATTTALRYPLHVYEEIGRAHV